MRKIIAPLHPGDKNPAVAVLQDAVRLLVERECVRLASGEREGILEALVVERNKQVYGDATRRLVAVFRAERHLGDLDWVDDETAAALNDLLKELGALEEPKQFVVRGHVRFADGSPSPGMSVQAFDQDVDSATLLGQAVTDSDGMYRISFGEDQFLKGDFGFAVPESLAPILRNVSFLAQPRVIKSGPDVWVGVQGEWETYLAKSEIQYNTGSDVEIDILIPPPPVKHDSELEELARLIIPRLKDMALQDLSDAQIEFLSKDAKKPIIQVQALVSAAKLVKSVEDLAKRNESGIGDLEFALLASFYVFERSGTDMSLQAILASDENWWSATISNAVTQGLIPKSVVSSANDVVALLTQLRAWWKLEPATATSASSLGDILKTLPASLQPKPEESRLVSSILDKNQSDLKILKSSLEANGWKPATVFGVLRSIGLQDLTCNHAPLVAALQKEEPDEQTASMLDLAGYGRKEWDALVAKVGVPAHFHVTEGSDGKQLYVDQLMRNVEVRMPTAFIASRIADGRIKLDEEARAAVLKLLEVNPKFRLGEDSVVNLFLKPESSNQDGLKANEVALVYRELTCMERVVKFSPTLEVAEYLRAAGYGSARQVTSKSRQDFVAAMADRLPGGAPIAAKVYDRASAAVAMATGLLLNASPIFNRYPDLPVMPRMDAMSAGAGAASARILTLPGSSNPATATLETLFGNQDYCECQSCASMYSPAAYLVDLLHMLDTGATNASGKTALDVLLERRPDLAEIELTCENSEIKLPYIDLVLELLEAPLAKDSYFNRFPRGPRDASGNPVMRGYDSDLDQGLVPALLSNELRNAGIDLGDWPTVKALTPQLDKRWMVHGNGWRLHLIGFGNPYALHVEIFPQSLAARDSGEALPGPYIYWAYDQLKVKRFPWTLPFDLAREETRAWLDRSEIMLGEVIDAYSGQSRWTSIDAACEVIGIGPSERALLRDWPVTPSAPDYTYWGFSQQYVYDPSRGENRDWYLVIRQVSMFRQRAGLTHRDLLGLLQCRFIQDSPGLGGRPLSLTGDECNSDEMWLGDDANAGLLTPSVLRRFFLFVRLQRKLGWTAYGLDRVIRAYGNSTEPQVLSQPVANSSEERFTEAFLVFVANVERLRRQTALAVESIANLYRITLDTQRYWDYSGSLPRLTASFYERLFYDPTVSKPRALGLELNGTRDNLLPLDHSSEFPKFRISDYVHEIASAVSCQTTDVLALLSQGETSIQAIRLGASGQLNTVVGTAISIAATETKQVEILLGWPSDATSSFDLEIQHSDDGTNFSTVNASDLGNPLQPRTTITQSSPNAWRMLRSEYTGNKAYVRIRATRTAGAGSLWLNAGVLTSSGLIIDERNFTNLSSITRHLLLARSLKMALVDYRTFGEISGINPLQGPASTLRFCEAYQKSKATGLGIPELDYLLRHRIWQSADAASLEQRIARILSILRARLQAEETALDYDSARAPELLRKLLLEVGWHDQLVRLVLGPDFLDRTLPTEYKAPLELGKSFPLEYQANLNSMPAALQAVLPEGLSYDGTNGQLVWHAGPLTAHSDLMTAKSALILENSYTSLLVTDRNLIDQAIAVLDAATLQTEDQAQALASLLATIPTITPKALSYDQANELLKWRSIPRKAKSDLGLAKSRFLGNSLLNRISQHDKDAIYLAFSELETAVSKIDQAMTSSLDPLVKLTQSIDLPTYTARYSPPGTPTSTPTSPRGTSIAIPKEWAGVFWYDPETDEFKYRGPMTTAWKDELSNQGETQSGSAYRLAVNALFDSASAYAETGGNLLVKHEASPPIPGELTAEWLLGECTTLQERCKAILDRIVPLIRERHALAIAKEVFSNEMAISADQANALIEGFRHEENGVQVPLLARAREESVLLASTFACSNPSVQVTRAAFPVQFSALDRFAKLALLVSRTALQAKNIPWLFEQWQDSASPILFDFSQLPSVSTNIVAPALWSQWEKFAILVSCAKMLAGSRVSDLDAIRQATGNGSDSEKIRSLAAAASIRPDDMRRLLADLNLSPGSSLLDPPKLDQLLKCLDLMRRSGADAATLHGWGSAGSSLTSAVRARQLARARVGEARWATASRPVLDQLRLRRRDALVDYWVHKLGLRDANDLYGELLLDPEMGPCMMTSRIKQAISSVQLFVYRALMNLESKAAQDPQHVPPSAINKTEWTWMKNYRVWEANRQVLLYPENWIEPELRSNKTPVYQEIETQLAQTEDGNQVSQSIISSYISNLDRVARLECISTCREMRPDGMEVIHVIGRTRSAPKEYFYRSYSKPAGITDSEAGRWSPWTKIDLDLDTDPIPYVFDNHLHLFWLNFAEKVDEAADPIKPSPSKPQKVWAIKLRWSVLDRSVWTAKKEALFWEGGEPDPEFKSYASYFTQDMFSMVPHRATPAGPFSLLLYGTRHRDPFELHRWLATLIFDGDRAEISSDRNGGDDSIDPFALYSEKSWADPRPYIWRFASYHIAPIQVYDDSPN